MTDGENVFVFKKITSVLFFFFPTSIRNLHVNYSVRKVVIKNNDTYMVPNCFFVCLFLHGYLE